MQLRSPQMAGSASSQQHRALSEPLHQQTIRKTFERRRSNWSLIRAIEDRDSESYGFSYLLENYSVLFAREAEPTDPGPPDTCLSSQLALPSTGFHGETQHVDALIADQLGRGTPLKNSEDGLMSQVSVAED